MLSIRYNYLSPFEFFLKPHFSEFNFPRIMICIDRNHLRATPVLNDAHLINIASEVTKAWQRTYWWNTIEMWLKPLTGNYFPLPDFLGKRNVSMIALVLALADDPTVFAYVCHVRVTTLIISQNVVPLQHFFTCVYPCRWSGVKHKEAMFLRDRWRQQPLYIAGELREASVYILWKKNFRQLFLTDF